MLLAWTRESFIWYHCPLLAWGGVQKTPSGREEWACLGSPGKSASPQPQDLLAGAS